MPNGHDTLHESIISSSGSYAEPLWESKSDMTLDSICDDTPVRITDNLCACTYELYRHKSLGIFRAHCVSKCILFLFTIAFSLCMTCFFRWGDVVACGTVLSDQDTGRCHPTLMGYFRPGGVAEWLLVAVMSVLWGMHALQTAIYVNNVGEIFRVLCGRGLTSERLRGMRWSDLLHFMDTRVGVSPNHFVQRLMRKENYIIAFIKHGLVGARVCGHMVQPCSSLLHYSLGLTLLSDIVTAEGGALCTWYFRNKRHFVNGLRTLAFIYTLLGPFIMVFVVYYSFLQCVQNCHIANNYFGSRTYTTAFQWKVRAYNEPMHMLQHRLGKSYMHAQDYMNATSRSWTEPMLQTVNFMTGTLLTTLLLLAVLDESMLETVQIGGRPLLLVLTIATSLFALTLTHTRMYKTNSMYSRSVREDSGYAVPEVCMQRVCAHTKYFPSSWNGLCHTQRVRREFEHVYSLAVVHFAQHILDTLLCPYVLLWHVIPQADAILEFVHSHSVPVDGVGYVCAIGGECAMEARVGAKRPHDIGASSALYMYESNDCL